MRNKLCIILSFCFIQTAIITAQKVHIQASGAGYENAELKVYKLSDPVTLQLIPVLQTKADSGGYFSFNINCTEPEQIIIKTGVYNMTLFSEVNKTYNLSLLAFSLKTNDDDLNPFFREVKLIPKAANDSLCLNNLISDFESEFNSVYDSVSARLFYNRGISGIPLLMAQLNIYPVTDTNIFYSDYVRYKKSMIDLMIIRSNSDKIKATTYLNNNPDFNNPACTELIGQVFNDYLKDLLEGSLRSEILIAINSGSFLQLKNVVLRDSSITDDKLLEYVLLINLYKEYYSGRIEKGRVLQIIDNQIHTTIYSNIGVYSGLVLEKLKRLLPGTILPSVVLNNQDGDSVLINDFKGRYVLLSFARSDSYSSLMEFSIVKMWQKKYENDLKIITILSDRDFKGGVARLRKAGNEWEILDGSGNEQLILFYEIRIFPTFILLDREGKIIMAPSRLPSEDLEKMIYDRIQVNKLKSGF